MYKAHGMGSVFFTTAPITHLNGRVVILFILCTLSKHLHDQIISLRGGGFGS
jgi:hypothetical protein